MNKNLEGKTAIVTGANRGLGVAIANSLALAGARVIMIARNKLLLEEAAYTISKNGGIVEALSIDVADENQINKLKFIVHEKFGNCSILVNNAGIVKPFPIEEFPLEDWNDHIKVNMTAPFLLSKAFIPDMKKQDYGRIINLTSVMAHTSMLGSSAYCSSKHGLLGLTKTLAIELAQYKITVNGVSPGIIKTDMTDPLLQNMESSKKILNRIPLARWGSAEEVAELVNFLCSEQASYITGTDIVIDGGWRINAV